MNPFLKLPLLAATGLLAFAGTGTEGGERQKKAVFILIDGISADVVEEIETPHLDSIAGESGYARSGL